jgi:hypothetical protein
MPKNHDFYVVLAHVQRGQHIVPITAAHRRDEYDDWHELVTPSTLTVWLAEATSLAYARDFVFAHLAGHAPHGVTKLFDKDDSPDGV